MSIIPGLADESELAKAVAGLSTQDKWEVTERQRGVTSAYQRGMRNYNAGLNNNNNDRTLALKRANMALGQRRNVGLSRAADTGFGASPAVAGAALASAAQRYAQEQAIAQQDWAVAQSALERAKQEAELAQAEGLAQNVRDAARRRDYANEIRRYGA